MFFAIVLGSVLAAALTPTPTPKPNFHVGQVDFANFDYPTNPCAGNFKEAPIRDGQYQYHNAQEEFELDVWTDKLSSGDLRGNGSLQAAVMLTCSMPVGSSSVVYLFDIHGAKATLLTTVESIDSGEGYGGNGLRFRIANHFLYVDKCSWDDGCATSTVTTYRLHGNTLQKVYTMKHKTPT